MRAVVVVIPTLVLSSQACTDGMCRDGLCADPDETRSLRGPCAAVTARGDRVSFSYDGIDERIEARLRDESGVWARAGYTYDAGGALMHAARGEEWPGDSYDYTRRDDVIAYRNPAATPSSPVTAEYDPTLFQLAPAVGVDRMRPRAVVGRVRIYDFQTRAVIETYTWERTPSGWVRTSSAGETYAVDVDDRGRIVAHDDLRYLYDGDRLVEKHVRGTVIAYTYDRGGNLIAGKADDHLLSATAPDVYYSYDCWD